MEEKKVVKKVEKDTTSSKNNKKIVKKVVAKKTLPNKKTSTKNKSTNSTSKKVAVDDYYASVNTSDKTTEKKSFKVKPKRTFKRVIKKEDSSFAKNKDKKSNNTQNKSKSTSWKKIDSNWINPVVARINAAAAAAAENSGEGKMKVVKSSNNNSSKTNGFVRRDQRTPQKRKNIQSIKVVWKQEGSMKILSSDKNFKRRWETSQNKNFWENKKKWWNNNKYNKEKKSALKPYNKWRKYKGYYEEPKELTFSRSKKAQAKKVEKKVEDIKQILVDRKWQSVVVSEVLTLKELSEKIGINLIKLIWEFMKNWMMVNINSKIDFDSASIVAEAFDVKLKKDDSAGLNVEDLMEWNISSLLEEEEWVELKERPPVISIMGHVDHGKTSLLDQIRSIWSNVTDWEAGWITQSIWAYQVEKEGKKITFLDTPGHEAFTVMRARWAKATDIAILVVAADEWVKPQTIESINHAKEADIPVIVAINKMDKEWANPDHIKGQLAEKGLTAEDWGGDTPMIPVSAKTGFGIDELLEIILLTAEMKELKANPNRNGVATIIESHLDMKLWPVSTVLMNTGTLKKWDYIVCNDSFWKVKVLKNYENKNIKHWLPGDPILIVWLDKVADWWDVVQVVNNAAIAKQKANDYRDIILAKKRNKISGLEILMSRIKAGSLQQLKVVVKCATNWSLEALNVSLTKLSTPETSVLVIHSWVGNITESDVIMASSSKAILIWFNVDIVSNAKKTLEKERVEFINSKIIYHITERIEKIVTGMLEPKEVITEMWEAKVWGIFYTSKEFMVLWLILQPENRIESGVSVRVIRKKSKIWEWKIVSLKSWIEEVKELEGPCECWIKFEWTIQPEMWDYLEIFKTTIEK